MPTMQTRAPLAVGLMATVPLSALATTLNAAATWLTYSFVPDRAVTLSKVRAAFSALTGSVSSGNITCTLYTDAANVPSVLTEARATTTGAYAVGWNEWTGFTTALTAGQQYWLVFKNLQGTPASNFPTFIRTVAQGGPFPADGTGFYGWAAKVSADSGSTWTSVTTANSGGWRLEYSDGSFDGWPVSNATIGSNTVGIYTTRESGAILTTSANARLNVRGVAAFLQKSGSPTGNLRARLYQGTTLLATSNTIPSGSAVSAVQSVFYFAASQALLPSTSHRVVIGEDTQSDTSTNRWVLYEYTVDSDSNSAALMPFAGTFQGTYYNGSTWANDATRAPVIALLLDTDTPFAYAGQAISFL